MNLSLSTARVRGIFEAELKEVGGKVIDCFEDEERLFLRAVLPEMVEIRKGDGINAGVALRAFGTFVMVHPYTFRRVCSNGAIMAHANDTRMIRRLLDGDAEIDYEEFRETVRECVKPAAFERAVGQMRQAASVQADLAIAMMTMMSRWPARMVLTWMERFTAEFEAAQDRTGYGVMNAVTAAARKTTDPDMRWNIEELGGEILERFGPTEPRGPRAVAMALTAG
jgi:hypothetical protein